MRACDLAEKYPLVATDDDAAEAARLFAERRLPALLVVDADERPYAIVPGSQLLRGIVPDFVLGDPSLAGLVTGDDTGAFAEQVQGLSVAQWLPSHRAAPVVVGPDATPLEIAALMVATHTPLVAVVESDGDGVRTVGAVTAARLMSHFLASE